MRTRALLAATATLVLAGSVLALGPAEVFEDGSVVVQLCTGEGAHPEPEEATVTSQAPDAIAIDVTIFRPVCAGPDSPVPVILHSHGWSGTKSSSGFGPELDAGFGVVSITQRGHGDSGGEARVQDPEFEAQDIKSVIDHVASLDWVAKDVDVTGAPIADDPVLFAMGGSYGGGYQTITALTEVRESGRTRFNALAPEITWFDLPQSLAPNDVVRSAWNELLYSLGVANIDMDDIIHRAFAWGATTGEWPDGELPLDQDDPSETVPDLDAFFHAHGPVAFVESGDLLDIPVLWRQGINDTLFNLNEGLHTFDQALTEDARTRSIFVGYHGGHVLPTAYPAVTTDSLLDSEDPCSTGGFAALRLAFFTAVAQGAHDPAAVLRGANPELARYNLVTDDGEGCVRLEALPHPATFGLGQDLDVVVEQIENGWMSTTGAGAATHVEVEGLEGPVTISGIPVLTGAITTPNVDQRVFFGLSRGTSIADAQLIQAQLTPLRQVLPTTGITEAFSLELAGIAVTLDDGEKLFLTVTPFSEQFHGHGSGRTPGWVGLSELEVHLPVVP